MRGTIAYMMGKKQSKVANILMNICVTASPKDLPIDAALKKWNSSEKTNSCP